MQRRADAPANDSLWRRMLLRAHTLVRQGQGRGIPVPLATGPYLVVAILGQSNAHGSGIGLDPSGLDAPHPDVHQWPSSGKSRGTVVLGVDPLFHEMPSKAVGFGVTFAKLMTAATGKPVLLVPTARGDTSFAPKNGYTWDPADRRTRINLYRKAIAAIDGAIGTVAGSRLAAILWHQGETDAPLTPAPVYAAKLDSVIDGLRERYGSDVPFLIGQMVPEKIDAGEPGYADIDAVHADTPNRRPRVAYVPGPRASHNADEIGHYNAAGQRELGRRMWQAYQSITSAPDHSADPAVG